MRDKIEIPLLNLFGWLYLAFCVYVWQCECSCVCVCARAHACMRVGGVEIDVCFLNCLIVLVFKTEHLTEPRAH